MTTTIHVPCPRCGKELAKAISGKLKLRTKSRIIVIDGGTGTASGICPGCGADIIIPFLYVPVVAHETTKK